MISNNTTILSNIFDTLFLVFRMCSFQLFIFIFFFFFFNDTATTEIYTLSLHDALPILLNFGLTFPVRIMMIKEGLVLDDELYTIHCCEAEHSIPAYSYLFHEKDKPGKF